MTADPFSAGPLIPGAFPLQRRTRLLWWIALAAIGLRLAVWFGTMLHPIPNEAGNPISPLHAESAIDLGFYQWSRGIYAAWLDRIPTVPPSEWFALLKALVYDAGRNMDGPIPPPMFAGVLALFDYGPDHSLPLAAAYLLLACGVVVVWLRWLQRHGLGWPGMIVMAALPGPLWLMLNVSTDLPFAALFAAFFLIFFSPMRARRRYLWAVLVAVVATLLRPHGVSLLLFLGAYEAFLSPSRSTVQKVVLAVALAVAAGTMFQFYGAYFWWYVQSSAPLHYFGFPAADYLAGIYPALPPLLDRPLSWFSLIAAKFLYLVGLRPSFGETEPLLVLIRAAPGLVLLPGLLYGLFRAPWAYRFLLAAYFAPVVLGSAQDRYVLAVTPLLIFFAARAGRELLAAVRGRRAVFPRLPLERA